MVEFTIALVLRNNKKETEHKELLLLNCDALHSGKPSVLGHICMNFSA